MKQIEDNGILQQMIEQQKIAITERPYKLKYYLLCYLLDKSFNDEPISFSSLENGNIIFDLMSEYLSKKENILSLLGIIEIVSNEGKQEDGGQR